MKDLKMKNQKYPILFSIYTVAILIVSFWLSKDKATYWLEVIPVLIFFPILFFTYRRFKFTTLAYVLICVHILILCVGGIYTYAEVPLGFRMQDWFGFARNNYDKIGHFAQGFIPAILTREVLLRTSPLRAGKWLAFITVSICLAISAMYELFEWWVCLLRGDSAEAFLGTQGYEWDAQSDMLLCLIGAIVALLALSKWHNKILNENRLLEK
ncbi:MAG: DUF2238 domain-containing protein [Prevotellaceae bacterium]|jgi:putative membrane protein|nr:DUF2238 domain-containing protein [Prevotellaceae bacterium]